MDRGWQVLNKHGEVIAELFVSADSFNEVRRDAGNEMLSDDTLWDELLQNRAESAIFNGEFKREEADHLREIQ